MNLENTLKFHFAKSTMISDSPRATSSDSLTGTDIMAAIGMTQTRADLGFSAFLGKMDISDYDRDRAIGLLTQYAMEQCDKVAALRKLETDIKLKVMQVLATFAFADYARSAASTRTCDCCQGNKFVEAQVMTMKHIGRPNLEERRETVKVLCHKCTGKGKLSNACQCKGRGKVLDKEKTLLQNGVPAYKDCSKCNGRKYARLPAENVRRALVEFDVEVSQPTWSRTWKPFWESLVEKCYQEEAYADRQLSKVTK